MSFKKCITALSLLLSLPACNKSSQPPPPVTTTANKVLLPCNGNTFCYLMDEEQRSCDAKYTSIGASATSPRRISIYYEENKGKFRIELSAYGSGLGSYPIVDEAPYRERDGAFLYFDGALGLKGKAGMITITDIDDANHTVSGTFYAIAERNDTIYKFTEGNFVNVPLK